MFASLPIWMLGLWFLPPHAVVVERPPMQLAQDYGSGIPLVVAGAGDSPQNLPSWSNSPTAWWNCESSAGSNVPNESTGTPSTAVDCDTDCDLSEVNSPTRSTDHIIGAQSCDFQEADTDRLRCSDATCGELDMTGTLSFSWFAWFKPRPQTETNFVIDQRQTATGGYDIIRQAALGVNCRIYNTSGTQSIQGAGPADNTWIHGMCLWDESTDELQLYLNGASAAGPTAVTGPSAADAVDFRVSTDSASSDWDGLIDEMGVFAGVKLTAAQICRICSCGLNGENCSCSTADPTQYFSCTADSECHTPTNTEAKCDSTSGKCQGYNDSTNPGCQSCTLPACNAAAP